MMLKIESQIFSSGISIQDRNDTIISGDGEENSDPTSRICPFTLFNRKENKEGKEISPELQLIQAEKQSLLTWVKSFSSGNS